VKQGELRGVVALDGPSGTGKSTVARRLASTLATRYLDTGAMYRAATLAVLRAGVDPTDRVRVAEVVSAAEIAVATDPAAPTTTLDGATVSAEIRGHEVTAAVSAVSAVPEVRAQLVAEQRRIIADAVLHAGGIVVEGRDIGSTVAPDAGLKIYLTASECVRAERRARQDGADGRLSTVEETLADVQRRDTYDSTRTASPLRRAQDAVTVDSTDLDLAGVQAALLAMIAQRGLCRARAGSGSEH